MHVPKGFTGWDSGNYSYDSADFLYSFILLLLVLGLGRGVKVYDWYTSKLR
jgi:hypothetical protein